MQHMLISSLRFTKKEHWWKDPPAKEMPTVGIGGHSKKHSISSNISSLPQQVGSFRSLGLLIATLMVNLVMKCGRDR
jgi:hypothetical protein